MPSVYHSEQANLLEKILSTDHLYTTLLQDHIDRQCSTPREREGFSKTDSTQYCNSRNTQNRQEAKLLAAPPMHHIQPNGNIRDYLRYPDVNKECKTEDKEKQSIQKDEARRNTEMKKEHRNEENYFTVKVLHCTLPWWTLYLKFTNKSQLSQILNWECS